MTSAVSVLYDTIRWEEKALLEAGKKKGIDIEMVDCKKLSLDLDSQLDKDYGTVLQRCVSYYRNVHSTAALEGMGVNVINCLKTGVFAGNKLYTHMLLKKQGVPTPYASVAFSKESALESLEKNGYPKVIIEGRESMYPIYQIHYLEEFVERPPRDIRAIMVGDKVVAAIYRYSGDGNWKTNMALGGRAEKCEVSGELEEICIKAKNAVDGQIVGVDLMESKEKGYVVHEVNNTTEYKNTVRVCEVDIPSLMIDYALNSKQ